MAKLSRTLSEEQVEELRVLIREFRLWRDDNRNYRAESDQDICHGKSLAYDLAAEELELWLNKQHWVGK